MPGQFKRREYIQIVYSKGGNGSELIPPDVNAFLRCQVQFIRLVSV
jgi:hypothetical protein